MEILQNIKINNSTTKNKNIPQKCGICGDSHYYKDCKYVVITSKVEDKKVPTKARLSLPDALEIKKLADETYSVFTKSSVEAGTEFGPFVAKSTLTLHPSIIFPIKVFSSQSSEFSEYYLDTTDENECCWMMFVNPANDFEEQNLICYQEGENIYFGTIKDIPSGEELRVWYSPYCAFKMQKNTLSFKDSSNLQFHLEDSTTNTDNLNTLIQEQQKIIPRVVWNCKFCYKLENNVTEFAKHLLTHYSVHKRKSCQFCQKKFRYSTEYKKHLKLFHGTSTEKAASNSQLQSFTKSAIDVNPSKNDIGGPLLLQCLNESLDGSFLQQPAINMFAIEESNDVLFDSNHLDVLGSGTIKDMTDMYFDTKLKELEKKDFMCDICLRKFATVKAIAIHLRLHIGIYFCSICKKVFGRAESYKHHKCNQIYSLKCPKCDKIFYQKKYLSKHIALFHERKYACPMCRNTYYSANELENHYCKQIKEKRKSRPKCPKCPKLFYSVRGVRQHIRKYHSEKSDVDSVKYICSECCETFSTKSIYQRHVITMHAKPQKYKCNLCDKLFSRNDVLKDHLNNVHMQGKNEVFECHICKKKFKTKRYLTNHLKSTHETAKYTCKVCSTTFKYSRNMVRHMKVVHTGQPSFEESHECPICKLRVKLKNSLQRHIKRKHPERYKNQCIELNARKDEIKHLKYKCPICQHEVKMKSSLQRHILKKHPDEYKSVAGQLYPEKKIVHKTFEEEFDNYMDLQKTIENMDFNIDTCNENLLSGSETIDKFLKESSDQISIFLADSPKTTTIATSGEISATILTDRSTNREVGLSMPDLCELDHQEINKSSKTINTSIGGTVNNLFESQLTFDSSEDVVLFVLNDKGSQ